MGVHTSKEGLDLPITGQPRQVVEDAPQPRHVALLGDDYVGMKPTMHVKPGDKVQRGQLVFEDKKTPGVLFTAPASGTVKDVDRGERRRFISVIIELDDSERSGKGATVSFKSFTGGDVAGLDGDQVRALLIESGMWTALRGRPFGRSADPSATPHAIFVTATDTHPLAPDPKVVLDGRGDDFLRGVQALAKLTAGKVFVCVGPGTKVAVPPDPRISVEEFSGPHPAGTVGYHIHVLDPVSRQKTVWHAGYQDVLAIGRLFATGELDVDRVVSLAGPRVESPRLLRTRLGASLDDLTAGQLIGDGNRVISGSVLDGRRAMGLEDGYLGRYHQQISVIREDHDREFLGWLMPGADKFSVVRAFASSLMPNKKFAMTTTTYGSHRAIVPIGMYEKVMPMDILPTFLLRSLMVGDLERAEELGVLELDEEDLALCTFVCPGKNDYGPALRQVLTTLEKEG
ncbi:MAG: Na(+)-translocating NADH-quinone reductase subunit A [Acidobacteria bacterium]|nr:Na(+)-translocating NADH-quinone reductase subunit A [Acidobacteriota bacterium]